MRPYGADQFRDDVSEAVRHRQERRVRGIQVDHVRPVPREGLVGEQTQRIAPSACGNDGLAKQGVSESGLYAVTYARRRKSSERCSAARGRGAPTMPVGDHGDRLATDQPPPLLGNQGRRRTGPRSSDMVSSCGGHDRIEASGQATRRHLGTPVERVRADDTHGGTVWTHRVLRAPTRPSARLHAYARWRARKRG
jgi:hypothetical protein